MKKIFMCLLVAMFIILINERTTAYEIPIDSIRFRVIPNSNNVEDIFMKEKVKDVINDKLLIYNPKNIKESRKIIESSLENIDLEIKNKFQYYKYNVKYDINYGLNYFPKKTYKNKTYDEGNYESLVVTIGEGKGDNFWCILFPPLCLLEAQENEKTSYEFFLVKVFNKLFKNK